MNRRELLALMGVAPVAVKVVPAMRVIIADSDSTEGATILFPHFTVTSHGSMQTFQTTNAVSLKGNESLVLGIENGELKIDVIKRA